jgi:hypothetical protein
VPDGLKKNWSIVRAEIRDWLGQMHIGLARFKTASLKFDKTNVLHLAMNLIEETFDRLPRTLAYSFVIWLFVYLCFF